MGWAGGGADFAETAAEEGGDGAWLDAGGGVFSGEGAVLFAG